MRKLVDTFLDVLGYRKANSWDARTLGMQSRVEDGRAYMRGYRVRLQLICYLLLAFSHFLVFKGRSERQGEKCQEVTWSRNSARGGERSTNSLGV